MVEKRVSGSFTLAKAECYCSIVDLYDIVARKLGYDPNRVCYDCRKICVTKSVQDQVFAFYKEEINASEVDISTIWLMYGPKANLDGEDFKVKVSAGFIKKELQ